MNVLDNEVKDNFENSLRPTIFEHFVGQSDVKDSLSIFVKAAHKGGRSLDHVLFYGSPGLGKTTLAGIIANEMGADFFVTTGAIITKPSDLISTLIKLKDGDVLFIDEIHRLPKNVEEFLYPALEDHAIDIITDGEDGENKTERVPLAKFTVVGATTRKGMISQPLQNRFGIDYRMEYYNISDLSFIAKRTASLLGLKIEDNAAELIAKGSRGTPRLTNRLVCRCRDVAEVQETDIITINIVEMTFKMLKIDENGLDNMDRKILSVLVEVYKGGPVGVKAIAATVDETKETIEQVHEPFLLQNGYIERTIRGRKITPKGRELVQEMNNG